MLKSISISHVWVLDQDQALYGTDVAIRDPLGNAFGVGQKNG